MGNRTIDVGDETEISKATRTTVKRSSGWNASSDLRVEPLVTLAPRAAPSGICRAMSQQGSEFRGNVSMPQKFVRLIGCHEAKLQPGLETQQYPNALKR